MKREFSLETFKEWLEAQHEDRKFQYIDIKGCMIATAIKDITGSSNITCADNYYYDESQIAVPFQDWMEKLGDFLVSRGYNRSIGQVKNWIKENNI